MRLSALTTEGGFNNLASIVAANTLLMEHLRALKCRLRELAVVTEGGGGGRFAVAAAATAIVMCRVMVG
jgi:hypothetical protein